MRCIVDGCTCKDPRVLSTRTLKFWRELARQRGETADRVIPAKRRSAAE